MAMAIADGSTSRPLTRRGPARGALAVVALDARLLRLQRAAQHVEANWPAPAYIPAAVLVATHPWGERGRRWLRTGWIFAVVLTLIVYLHARRSRVAHPGAEGSDRRRHSGGAAWRRSWPAIARRRGGRARCTSAPTVTRMRRRSRITRAHTRFRRATRPDSATFVFAVNQSGRRNQYDLWPRFPDVARPGDDLLLVLDDSDDFHSSARRLAPFFVHAARGDRIELAAQAGRTARGACTG